MTDVTSKAKPHASSPTIRRRRRTRFASARLLLLAALTVALVPLPQASALQGDPVELASEGLVRLDSINSGALLFESNVPGWYVPAPTLHTDIEIAVSGPLARTTVTQRFRNVADVFVEGKYVFPLPEGSAVDTLRMQVGTKWIEGRIEGREEAKLIYEQAAAAGQVASLVEQQRPNVFTTSVANIAPQSSVIIQIEYQETLSPRDGMFGLRIPLVVAPRYSPAGDLSPPLRLSSRGWTTNTRSSPNAPLQPAPATSASTTPGSVDIAIDLDAGFPLGDIQSPNHHITVDSRFENQADITLDGPAPADRDFYLSWRPRELAAPYAAGFTEHRDNETHYVAMVTPPSASAIAETRPAREVIFVQDTSGSMAGDSILQAQSGLRSALRRLDEADTFNIIEFDSEFTQFANEPIQATPENVQQGLRFVDRLTADNGTEMRAALAAALTDTTPNDRRLRQVIFLTDGAVSNESAMLDLIDRQLGSSRLFTVGIGSAPNSYFMTAAARAGRGSFVFISNLDEVGAQMQTLFTKIENPAIVGLAIDGLPPGAEVSPSPLPDLYVGDPVTLMIRIPSYSDNETLQLTGRRGNDDWQLDVSLTDAQIRPGVSKLWARERIRDLEALWLSPEVDYEGRDEIDQMILATALDFGLVSRLTSLVAVDAEITRPNDATTTTTEVVTSLPNGWDPNVFFSATDSTEPELPDPASALSQQALDRLAAAATANEQATAGQGAGVPLPVGGAGWQFRASLGGLLVLLGAAVLRRRPADTDR